MVWSGGPWSGAPWSGSAETPVDIEGVSGALEITGQTGTASAGVNVAGAPGALTITGTIGTVVAGVAAIISGVAGALVIAGTIGTVEAGTAVNVSGVTGSLEITGTVGTVEVGHNIAGSPGSLEIVGQTGTVQAGTAANVAGVAGALEITGQIGDVEAGTGVNVEGVSGSLEITGQTGTVQVGHAIAGSPGALEITGQIGTANVGGTVDVTGDAGSLEITGQVGTVQAYTAAIVDGVTGSLELSGTTGTVQVGTAVNVAGVTGALEITGQTGAAVVGHAIAGTVGALEISGKVGAFTTETGVNIAGVKGSLVVSGTVGIVTAAAAYDDRVPPPGDLNALVSDETATLVGIFEVYVYRTSLGGSEWVRWSTAPLTTEPDDSLPNHEFDDRVSDFSMSSNLWSSDDARGIILGESRANTAEVTLDNADGALDGLFNPDATGSREYHWRRRPARFRIGHASWGYDDYVVVWSGHVDEAQSDGQTATMQLRDILERLDSPVTERVYQGNAWVGESASSVAIGTGSKSFVLPNLITNGAFGTNLSGWTAGAGWAQSSGTATKTAGSASALAQDDVPTAAEQMYRIRATLVRTAGSITVTVGGLPIEGATYSASGTIDCTFTADGSASDIAFSADAAFAGSLDDITMRQEPEAVPGEFAVVARTSALSTSWMWGEVLSWTPSTGTLVVDVDIVGGSGTFSDWSIWLRPDEGGADMAGKIVPDPLGICRRFEPDYLGSAQGHILYRGAAGVWSVSSAYDGALVIPIAGSFPPGAGEVYVDENRGLAWVANDVTPELPFTVNAVSGTGTLAGRRVWTQPGSVQWIVPSGVTSITAKLWGAGGGAGDDGVGGAGAFVSGSIAVTPGETLTIVVPGGGRRRSGTQTNPGIGPPLVSSGPGSAIRHSGGGARWSSDWTVSSAGSGFWNNLGTKWTGGGGGGGAAVYRGALTTVLAVAGGGGGASKNHHGGAAGENGDDGGDGSAIHGNGATPSAVGAGGTISGDPARQGDSGFNGEGAAAVSVFFSDWRIADPCPGAGGGGYRGGGAGAANLTEAGAGGGGSSWLPGGTIDDGSGTVPGGDDDADYAAGVGVGGVAASGNGWGGDGRVVITYDQTLTGADPTAANLLRDVLRDRRGYRLIEADQSTLVSVAADAGTKTFTFGASIAALGIGEMDVFSLSGTAENAGTLFTVQSVTDTTIRVKEAVTDMGADTAFGMTVGEVDGTALAALDAVTDPMGYVLRDDGETARRVVDQILGSTGWFLDVTRHGLVTVGAFGPPAETADHTIDETSEGDIFEIVREPAAPALWRVRAGAERCWRVHSKPEIATSAGDADRKFVLSEWRENPPALGTDTDVRTKDLAAEETFFPTLFAFRASLNTRVPEWLSWFSPDRQAYRITIGPKAWAIRQGETVSVTAPSIGITEPVNMVVIGRDIEHAAMTGRIIVWG